MDGARFGLSAHHCDVLTRLLIEPLSKVGCKVGLFGSRARGDFREFSDIDILVEGHVPTSLLSTVQEALEESNLPFRVDIVQEKDLAPAYRQSVMRDRVWL